MRKTYNNILFGVIAIVMLFCFSCRNDHEETVEEQDFSTILPNTSWICYFGDTKDTDAYGEYLSCHFNDEERLFMMYLNFKNAGSDEFESVGYFLSGTYKIDGKTILADFSDVKVKHHLSSGEEIPTSVKGFTDGEPRTMKMSIVSYNNESLMLKDDIWNTITYAKIIK